MSNRERFEDWYLAKYWLGSESGRAYLGKEENGLYTYAMPQELWEVWQAAQPTAGEPVYQCKKKGGIWHECSKVTHNCVFAGEEFEKRILWTAPPAAAPVAAGEPVAMQARMPGCRWENYHKDDSAELVASGMEIRWLYAAPPAAEHGDEAAATLAKALGLLWKTTNFLPRGGSLDGRVSAFLAQHAPEPVASAAAAMRAQAGEGGEV